MFRKLVIMSVLLLGLTPAFAGELDNDNSSANHSRLEGTVVFRVNNNDGAVDVAQVNEVMSAGQVVNESATFAPVSANNLRSELDQDAGSSSWYYYRPFPRYYGYQSYFYYYGNCYYPYYYYNYGYYSYYYYNARYSYWW